MKLELELGAGTQFTFSEDEFSEDELETEIENTPTEA